jgi:hypothetical protein
VLASRGGLGLNLLDEVGLLLSHEAHDGFLVGVMVGFVVRVS